MSVAGPNMVLFVVFLYVFWLQVAIQPFALFRHSVCDNVSFTVMFH